MNSTVQFTPEEDVQAGQSVAAEAAIFAQAFLPINTWCARIRQYQISSRQTYSMMDSPPPVDKIDISLLIAS